MDDIDDVTNLANLSDLLNQDAINQNLDIEKIERAMIGSTGIRKAAESDPAREYDEAMKELANDTGIILDDIMGENVDELDEDSRNYLEPDDFGDIEGDGYDVPAFTNGNNPSENYEDAEDSEDFMTALHKGHGGTREPDLNTLKGPSSGQSDWGRPPPPLQSQQPRPARVTTSPNRSNPPNRFGSQQRHQARSYPKRYPEHDGNKNYNPNRHNPNQYEKYHEDDNRYQHLDQVMQDYAGDNVDQFNIEQEQREDTKTILLEDIDELRFELESDGVELDRIPTVNSDSTLEDVQQVHKMLRMKYDRRRYNGFGNELILAGVHGLEHVFNGERKWGPYNPDLTGWHNTVRAKLRRMRYETASVVSDVMNDYNIGPITRIMLELVPSAVIYSKDRREQRGQSNYTFDQMSDAYNELAEFE